MLKEIFYILFSLFSIVSICGCTPTLLKFDVDIPAQTLTYAGAPPIPDQRPRFREIFCGLINESSEAQQRQIKCEDYLWRLNDEKQGDKLSQPLPMHDASLRIILVTGAFAECFPKMGKPYQDEHDLTAAWGRFPGSRRKRLQQGWRNIPAARRGC